MNMFCYQCEQTANGIGCNQIGICGKDPLTANLQDLLIYASKGLAGYVNLAKSLNINTHKEDIFLLEALFTTITNVNFSPERLKEILNNLYELRIALQAKYEQKCLELNKIPQNLNHSSETWIPAKEINELGEQGKNTSLIHAFEIEGKTITGLKELLLYGLKGMAAYAHHAYLQKEEDESVYCFISDTLSFLNKQSSMEDILKYIDQCGAINLKVMELLDAGNNKSFGIPEPTMVSKNYKKGKCILVSGHELGDLYELLKQTENKGINIYTHGEMLPAHSYPELKKFPHLVGHYGSAWHNQRVEFPKFPGTILMTTNCIQNPEGYKENIFTSGLVAWDNVKHLSGHNYSALIERALAMKGFEEDTQNAKDFLIGFGHSAVLSKAPEIIEAIKAGDIKRFFLIGGCDGHETNRNYFTEFAESIPEDCVILTLGCGKFKVNGLELGNLKNGIPRLLDLGQCNDAYSAIKIAGALSQVFNIGLNELPLSLVISWFEQKAICILLTLLHLGIKNIYIGPNLPAFITEDILALLQENYSLHKVENVKKDLADCLAR